MVALSILAAVSIMFLKVSSTFLRLSISMTLFVGLGTAYYLGWEKLEPRMVNIFSDDMSGRSQIYGVTNKMIDEYGLFGSGPGSFEATVQFELGESFTKWQSWVHCDYLELYLTFGKPGIAILIALTAILALQYLATFMAGSARTIKWYGLLTLVGVATHAILDFPLQVYSILTLLILIIVAISNHKVDPRPRHIPTEN